MVTHPFMYIFFSHAAKNRRIFRAWSFAFFLLTLFFVSGWTQMMEMNFFLVLPLLVLVCPPLYHIYRIVFNQKEKPKCKGCKSLCFMVMMMTLYASLHVLVLFAIGTNTDAAQTSLWVTLFFIVLLLD